MHAPRSSRLSMHALPSYTDSGLPEVAFLTPRTLRPALSVASSSLWIALWLVEAAPTRLPSARSLEISPPERRGLAHPRRAPVTRGRPSGASRGPTGPPQTVVLPTL